MSAAFHFNEVNYHQNVEYAEFITHTLIPVNTLASSAEYFISTTDLKLIHT